MTVKASLASLLGRTRDFWRQYKRVKTGLIGLGIIIVLTIIAVLASYISPFNPFDLHNELNVPPGTSHHILGTDYLGRDLLSNLIWGAGPTLLIGFAVAGISLVIGIVMGVIPGWYGGILDHLFSRFFELFLVMPTLLLIIVLVTIFGATINIVVFCIAITLWPSNAKLTRAQVMSLKNRGYVEAASGIGARTPRILFVHILPNGIGPVLANSFMQMARAILTEASLSFLGLSDTNIVTWGRSLFYAEQTITSWWMILFPGMMIAMSVLGLNFIGDAVNYVLNPRMRERML